MACPSDEYFARIKTSSGLTPDNSYTFLPNELAYGEWDALSLSLAFDCHSAFKNYTQTKPQAEWSSEETTKWETLRDELFELDTRYGDLPGPKGIFVAGVEIAALLERQVQLAVDYGCMLQRIDEATESIGGKPHGPPGTPPKPPPGAIAGTMTLLEKALTIVGIGVGGTLLIMGVRALQNRKGGS
jgi:hypothetical protein